MYVLNFLGNVREGITVSFDTKNICDNEKFWNTVKPLFSDKINASHKISLINENNIISENKEIVEIFNDFFSTAATNLEIDKGEIYITEATNINDPILNAIKKYETHPSIKKITETVSINDKVNFSSVTCDDMKCIVNDLDISKATVYSSIPTGIYRMLRYIVVFLRGYIESYGI